ncbi:MAG: hypothetical protein RL021_307 [Bacteroidota bacterium]|jgi:ankyrin repeat protein
MKNSIPVTISFVLLLHVHGFAKSSGLNTVIQSGDLPALEAQLKSGMDVNALLEDGCTPLFIACRKGDMKMAALLINSGADVNLPSRNTATPLIEAARAGNADLTELLLSNGAEISYQDSNRMNAFDYVVESMPSGPAADSGYGRVFSRLQEELKKHIGATR